MIDLVSDKGQIECKIMRDLGLPSDSAADAELANCRKIHEQIIAIVAAVDRYGRLG